MLTAHGQRTVIIILLALIAWILSGKPTHNDFKRYYFRVYGGRQRNEERNTEAAESSQTHASASKIVSHIPETGSAF